MLYTNSKNKRADTTTSRWPFRDPRGPTSSCSLPSSLYFSILPHFRHHPYPPFFLILLRLLPVFLLAALFLLLLLPVSLSLFLPYMAGTQARPGPGARFQSGPGWRAQMSHVCFLHVLLLPLHPIGLRTSWLFSPHLLITGQKPSGLCYRIARPIRTRPRPRDGWPSLFLCPPESRAGPFFYNKVDEGTGVIFNCRSNAGRILSKPLIRIPKRIS